MLNKKIGGTYKNMKILYDCIYEEMVNAGVAKKLCHPIYYNEDGEKVDKKLAFGLASYHRIVNPDHIIFVDETGCNTNMSNNAFAGGKKFVCENKVSTK